MKPYALTQHVSESIYSHFGFGTFSSEGMGVRTIRTGSQQPPAL